MAKPRRVNKFTTVYRATADKIVLEGDFPADVRRFHLPPLPEPRTKHTRRVDTEQGRKSLKVRSQVAELICRTHGIQGEFPVAMGMEKDRSRPRQVPTARKKPRHKRPTKSFYFGLNNAPVQMAAATGAAAA